MPADPLPIKHHGNDLPRPDTYKSSDVLFMDHKTLSKEAMYLSH